MSMGRILGKHRLSLNALRSANASPAAWYPRCGMSDWGLLIKFLLFPGKTLMRLTRFLAIATAACCCSLPAQAADKDKIEMACTSSAKPYEVSFDKKTRLLKTSSPKLPDSTKILKVQSDADGVLIWVSIPGAGQSPSRDALVSIRKEKWVKIFFGNGSHTTDNCR